MKLRILETSDIHSYISSDSFKKVGEKELFSMSRAKTYIDNIRKEDKNLIYIDNGDNIQGSPLATLYHNKNDLKNLAESYNMIKPDCLVLGNHDFNYGQDYLKSYINNLKAPVLSANTIQKANNGLDISPYIIKEIEGIRIGILGLITQHIPHWENPKNIEGLEFKSALETAKYFVPILKDDEKCDIVIISYHGGFAKDLETGSEIQVQNGENEGYDLLYSGLNFDVLLTGHTHQEIAGIYNDIPVVQPAFSAKKIAEINLEIDENKKIISKEARLIDLSEIDPDPVMENYIKGDIIEVQEFLDKSCNTIIEPSAIIDSVVDAQIHGHPYVNLINQIQMENAGVDIAGVAIYTKDAKGIDSKVNMRRIIDNYMFNNTLMKVELTGKEFRQILEFNSNYFILNEVGVLVENPEYFMFNYDIYSGIDYTYDFCKEKGQRLTSVKYHGRELKDDEKITFATNNYRAIGGGDFPVLDGSQVIWESSQEMPQLIFDYIEKREVVEIKDYDSINVIGYKNVGI
ncbi:bifunctional UDP-sugar hydrolase/5'-nucleotidase [uncultured Anaerococcus sp.]|uniref:bifunctional metallophosphatase/5'-nucleotidase n=1 Tax=uncultured Anaerococcus sp. TaxID=293428 RepID=UPI0026300AF1|nr:bifunctional UDP-sugar hydrolase/5'-nucleotidase [uncultured Anaerococcus sp.]